MHLQQGDVVLVGELVKIPVCDNFLYSSVNMSVSLISIEHMVLPYSHKKVARSDTLKRIKISENDI